jgi:sulfite reductase (NADPH) hemoprotein beta-component
MYVYSEIDQRVVDERVAEYRDQTARFLAGELSENEFRDLRLRNGLYIQRMGPMLRVSIPYGLLSTTQLRMISHIARKYDKGYAHFTTRQNVQYHWLKLEEVPDLLADLASVQMHAIQTSGNCVRNVTADHLSGIAPDEIEDARPWAEILRQYSTLHPEFLYLPRKFKFALSGREDDGAACWLHDIGYRIVKNAAGEVRFKVLVGGGMGRTPVVAEVIQDELEPDFLLSYTEAILRVYNLHGNRDNMHKARIKILVRRLGIEAFKALVDKEHERIKGGPLLLSAASIARIKAFFTPPAFEASAADGEAEVSALTDPASPRYDDGFARWYKRNTKPHKAPGYRVAWVALKQKGIAPGDITSEQMDAVAKLADRYSLAEVRSTHDQHLLLPHVQAKDLYAVWQGLAEIGLARANVGTLTDMICCPGLDFCNLANASSIPIALKVHERFDDLDYLYDLGPIELKMSGCINACGHHHGGHIGILGIDKKGVEAYQILLGGSVKDDASLGKWIGQALSGDEVIDALEQIVKLFATEREGDEVFIDYCRRVGLKPFADAVYGKPA